VDLKRGHDLPSFVNWENWRRLFLIVQESLECELRITVTPLGSRRICVCLLFTSIDLPAFIDSRDRRLVFRELHSTREHRF
jgi:hypothetical protein